MNKHSITLMALSTLAFSGLALSCEYHMGGFGMGGFAQNHPLMQRHMQQPIMSTLSVKHERVVNVAAQQDVSLPISYLAPPAYQDIIVQITGSDGIEFSQPPTMTMDKISGTYTLNYRVAQPGKYQIILTVNALRGEVPIALEQRVNVTAV